MKQLEFLSEGYQLSGILRESPTVSSKAVVFCHGAFEFQDNWFDFAERLSDEGIPTFTFDFTGHGGSEGLRSHVDLRIWAHNIRDALNELGSRGYDEFALVGWGIGGSAVLLAAAHDRRLRCAVVLSAPVHLVPGMGERLAYGLISFVARLKKAVFKRPLTLSRLNELEQIHITYDEGANQAYFSNPKLRASYQAVPVPESLDSVWFDITHTVEKVNIPVLVIHGAEDELIPVEQSEKLYQVLQGQKKLKILQDSGHALHLDHRSEEVYQLLSGWVKRYLDPADRGRTA